MPGIEDHLMALSHLANADRYLCQSDDYWLVAYCGSIESALQILRGAKLLVIRGANLERKAR